MKIKKQTKTQIGSRIPKGTADSVLFLDSNLKLAEDNANFKWDDSNNRLTIGSTVPTTDVHAANKKYVDDKAFTSPLTTKGDVYTYDTADVRLGVGTNDDVLTAASGETTGLKWSAPAATTYARSATLVVAASDSKDTTNADYFCDGTADEVQINEAIAALPAVGGCVMLMDGTYNIAAPIDMGVASNITLSGQGGGTLVFLTANSDCNMVTFGDGSTFREYLRITNIRFDGNKVNQGVGNWDGIHNRKTKYIKIDHCWFSNIDRYCISDNTPTSSYCIINNNHFISPGTAGVYLNYMSDGGMISNNNFFGCTTGVFAGNCSVNGNMFRNGYKDIAGGSNMLVTGNYSEGATYSCYITNSYYVNISGNHFRGQIYLSGCHYFTVDNNYVEKNRIYLSACDSCSVVGNVMYQSSTSRIPIELRGGSYNISVIGNSMFETKGTVIKLDGADYCIVSGNTMRDCGKQTNDTYPAILLTGTATYNIISNNHVSSSEANKPQYGIREAASADDFNVITGNICTDAITANISIQGTSTEEGHNIAP